MLDRRQLLTVLGATAAAALLPRNGEALARLGRSLHADLAVGGELRALSEAEAALVTTLSEIIIPETDTPGATSVNVTGFVDKLLADWYSGEERGQFLAGLAALDQLAIDKHGSPFVQLSPDQQTEIVALVDDPDSKDADGTATKSFGQLKGLTVYGYFTSERVMKEVTHVLVTPGRFDGCVPM